MARKKSYDREQALADWKTGGYTIRELARRHGVSHTAIGKLVKGVDKDLIDKVDKVVNLKKELKEMDDKEREAVAVVVDFVEQKRLAAKKIDKKLDGIVDIATQKALELLESPDLKMDDIEKFSKAQNNFRVGIGTQDKFTSNASANVNIQNTNAQQNITPQDLMNAIKFKHSISNSRG